VLALRPTGFFPDGVCPVPDTRFVLHGAGLQPQVARPLGATILPGISALNGRVCLVLVFAPCNCGNPHTAQTIPPTPVPQSTGNGSGPPHACPCCQHRPNIGAMHPGLGDDAVSAPAMVGKCSPQ
jgi:hypothetical protein